VAQRSELRTAGTPTRQKMFAGGRDELGATDTICHEIVGGHVLGAITAILTYASVHALGKLTNRRSATVAFWMTGLWMTAHTLIRVG